MTITTQHPRNAAEADSSFSELAQTAYPGDIVRRVEQLKDGTLVAAEGVIDSITPEAIKDRGGAILAEAADDTNDFVLLYHQQAPAQFPDVRIHHWVLDGDTGKVYFADPEHQQYKEVTTHTTRTPDSFDTWAEMALRYATPAGAPAQPSSAWSHYVDHSVVKVGDTMMRQVQLATGTTVTVKGTVAAVSVHHDHHEHQPTIVTSSGTVLCGTGDELSNMADSTVTIWHLPQAVNA